MEENQENNLNLQPTPPIDNVVETTPPVDNVVKTAPKKGKMLVFTNVLLALLVIGLGIYIFITNKKIKELEKEDQEKITQKGGLVVVEAEVEEETVEKPQTKNFVGKYIKAELPEKWTIKEYKDGEGSYLITEGSDYSGLTGLEISNGNKTIMEMHILDGVGSVGCQRITLFKDSPKGFQDDKEKMNKEIGVEAEILDYTNTAYSEITLFGLKIRRVETEVFYDVDSNTTTFEASCERNWIPLKGLKKVAPVTLFQIVISKEATSNELATLDSILESLETK